MLERVIELQIATGPYLTMLLNELRARARQCCLMPFEVTAAGQTIVVDHIAFVGGAELKRAEKPVNVDPGSGVSVPTHPISIAVPMEIQLGSFSQSNLFSFVNPVADYTLKLGLALTPTGMCASVSVIENDAGSPALSASMATAISQCIGTICTPFAVAPIAAVLGIPLTQRAALLSANKALTRLAVRIEVNQFAIPASEALAFWMGFDNQIAAALPARPWSVLIGHELFTQSIENRV
jgi:hypothetical protein